MKRQPQKFRTRISEQSAPNHVLHEVESGKAEDVVQSGMLTNSPITVGGGSEGPYRFLSNASGSANLALPKLNDTHDL